METFEEMLAVGGKSNSLGRSAEVIDAVTADPERLNELFACIHAEDAWVRMRAIDAFEKIISADPSLVAPYQQRLFDELMGSTQPSIQWHLAQLFAYIDLDANQRAQATAWLLDRVATVDADWIVAVNTMRTLVGYNERGWVSDEDLTNALRTQQDHHSKTVRKKAAHYLEAT